MADDIFEINTVEDLPWDILSAMLPTLPCTLNNEEGLEPIPLEPLFPSTVEDEQGTVLPIPEEQIPPQSEQPCTTPNIVEITPQFCCPTAPGTSL